MKKRMLTMLLALVMIVSVLPFSAMAAEAACTHSSGTYIEKEEANCLYKGAIYYFCKDCNKHVWTVELPLAPHTYGTDSKCDVCGVVCKHKTYGPKVTVAATCTKPKSVTQTCTECGYKKTSTSGKALGHKFVSVDGLVATCTVAGYTPHKECSVCHEKNSEYVVLKAKGHDLKTIDKAATCTADGVLDQECQREGCSYKNTEIRNKTGHNYIVVKAKAPTCAEIGHNEYKQCVNCGVKKKDSYTAIPMLPHVYVNGLCQGCGVAAPSNTVPSVPAESCTHPTKSTYITSSDCTNEGYKVIICDKCDTVISTEIRPAKGHTEEVIVQDPTCTEDGFVKVVCKVCQTQLSNTVREHYGHSFNANGICSNCGGADSNKFTHDFQDVYVVG